MTVISGAFARRRHIPYEPEPPCPETICIVKAIQFHRSLDYVFLSVFPENKGEEAAIDIAVSTNDFDGQIEMHSQVTLKLTSSKISPPNCQPGATSIAAAEIRLHQADRQIELKP